MIMALSNINMGLLLGKFFLISFSEVILLLKIAESPKEKIHTHKSLWISLSLCLSLFPYGYIHMYLCMVIVLQTKMNLNLGNIYLISKIRMINYILLYTLHLYTIVLVKSKTLLTEIIYISENFFQIWLKRTFMFTPAFSLLPLLLLSEIHEEHIAS